MENTKKTKISYIFLWNSMKLDEVEIYLFKLNSSTKLEKYKSKEKISKNSKI